MHPSKLKLNIKYTPSIYLDEKIESQSKFETDILGRTLQACQPKINLNYFQAIPKNILTESMMNWESDFFTLNDNLSKEKFSEKLNFKIDDEIIFNIYNDQNENFLLF